MTEDDIKKNSAKFCSRTVDRFSSVRGKSPTEVRFTQGDYNVLMREVPIELAALHQIFVKHHLTISMLEQKIEQLESKHERRLAIVREASAAGRSVTLEGVKIFPGGLQGEGEAAAAEHGDAAANPDTPMD